MMNVNEEIDVLKLEYLDWTGKIKTTMTIDLKGGSFKVYGLEDDYIRNKVEKFLTFIGIDECD